MTESQIQTRLWYKVGTCSCHQTLDGQYGDADDNDTFWELKLFYMAGIKMVEMVVEMMRNQNEAYAEIVCFKYLVHTFIVMSQFSASKFVVKCQQNAET